MNIPYTLLLLALAGGCWLASKYFEKRQQKLKEQHCISVQGKVCRYAPLEGADRKGRPVFATVLSYEVEGKSYEVQLDDQIAEVDQKPEGTSIELLCDKNDPSQCMLAEFPIKKGLFGW